MEKCRLCYKEINPEICQHIFHTKFKPPIWKIIKQISNLIITKNDPYTKNICGPCFKNLIKYSDFRTLILDTNYRIQHENDPLSEKTNDNCDYFEVHYTPTRSDNDSLIIEEHIKMEDDPLEIDDAIKEEFNNNSTTVIENQDIKELVIVDGINNNDKITACYTSPSDNSNETNERQSYTISTNNYNLKLSDNDDMITCDGNEISTAKDIVGSSKNFDNDGKNEESDIEMSTNNREKYHTHNTKRRRNARYALNMNLKVRIRQTLQNHTEIQTHEKPLKSNIFNNNSDKVNLCSYKEVQMDNKSYRCNICNKHFSQKKTLLRHERVHTGEKPFKCNICNKQFSLKTNLVIHERVHTGEKPYKCNICNKRFTQKTSLVHHEWVHTGVKPFKCSICNKQFTQKKTLLRHERIHTGKNPFKCNICDQSFSSRWHLKDHLNIHIGQNPYCCNICNKMFAFISALDNHLKIHRNKKEFECDFCNKAFNLKSSLRRHYRGKHLVEKS